MRSILTLAAVVSGAGLLMSFLAIPLVRRRVPPNAFYGIRTKASFASETDWYRINAIGGRYLVLSGIVVLVTGLIGFFLPKSFYDAYAIAATLVILLAAIIPGIRLCRLKPSGDRNRGVEKPSPN